MILRNLARRKLRTLFSVGGVALSIVATIALLRREPGPGRPDLGRRVRGRSELTVVQRIPRGLTFGYPGALPNSVVDGLRDVPGVARASPLILVPASITREVIFLIYGVEPDGPAATRLQIISGRRLRADHGPMVLLGRRAAEGMDKSVGDSISINTRELPIVGIYRSGVSLEDGGAMMTLAAATEFLGLRDGVSLVKVKADDPRRVGAVQRAIEARFSAVTAITSGRPSS